MLMKIEGAIKNGQSRETGNNGHTGHRTKTNKTKTTTYETVNVYAQITDTSEKDYTDAVILQFVFYLGCCFL
jgi:hypothetical protein